MLIELTDDFICLLRSVDSEYEKNKALLLIDNLLQQVILHHHVVFASTFSIDILQKEEKISYFGRLVLAWMKKKILDLNSIKQETRIVAELAFGKSTFFSENNNTRRVHYLINVFDLDEIKESVLITENMLDYNFYLNIAKWIRSSTFYDFYLKNIASNGANADKTILTRDKEKDFSCCIFDSDKDFKEAANGSTLKNAINGEKQRVNKYIPFYIYALPAREKENIFPFNEYLVESNIEPTTRELISLLSDQIDEELQSYYDLKDGIKYKKLKDCNHKPRWEELYVPFIRECIDKKICDHECACKSCEQETCIACSYADKKYIPGIGDKLLAVAAEKFFDRYPTKSAICTIIDEIFLNQKFILNIWQAISDLLFNFGCCISGSINFIA